MSPTIALGRTGQMWEDSLIAEAQTSGAAVVACRSLVELLVAAESGRARIVVVAEDFPRLAEGLSQLRGWASVVVVGSGPGADCGPERADLQSLAAVALHAPPPSGRLVTVWGPAGSWGATTVAIGLARSLRAIDRTLLLDANVHAPSVALEMSLEPGGLVQACLSADRGDLRVPIHEVAGLNVVTGAAPHLYPAVHAGALRQVLDEARADRAFVVADVDSAVDAAGEIGLVPDWTTATTVALEAADHVVIVTGQGPLAEQRLFAALPAVADRLRGPATVVVNRCTDPHAVTDGFARRLADYLPDVALGWISGPVTTEALAPIAADVVGHRQG